MWDPNEDRDDETAQKQFDYEQFKENELMEKRIVDRSTWGKGEWDNEPDRVDFIHAGFSCFMLRGPMGSWCGYVGVPSDHPLYGQDYNEDRVMSLDVHGGLTYANKCQGAICHVPQEGMPDDVWWLGFDCAHYMDKTPYNYKSIGLPHEVSGVYRNVEYVIAEIKKLADQLKEIK